MWSKAAKVSSYANLCVETSRDSRDFIEGPPEEAGVPVLVRHADAAPPRVRFVYFDPRLLT